MADLTRIAGFDWDEGNSRKSEDKHGVSREEAEQVFLDGSVLVADDAKHSQSERRFHALGRTEVGRRLQITFTLRGEGTRVRVVSARDMNRKERGLYEEET